VVGDPTFQPSCCARNHPEPSEIVWEGWIAPSLTKNFALLAARTSINYLETFMGSLGSGDLPKKIDSMKAGTNKNGRHKRMRITN
jgi:hypothetical protein